MELKDLPICKSANKKEMYATTSIWKIKGDLFSVITIDIASISVNYIHNDGECRRKDFYVIQKDMYSGISGTTCLSPYTWKRVLRKKKKKREGIRWPKFDI